MLEIASNEATGEPVQMRRITERHGIPAPFLVQIMQQLKRAGLVVSTRGAGGGYRLAVTGSEITLADLIDVIDGSEETSGCAAAGSPFAAALMEVYRDVSATRREQLSAVTLAGLLEAACTQQQHMWYI